jgi:hypothetical protein
MVWIDMIDSIQPPMPVFMHHARIPKRCPVIGFLHRAGARMS